jgi:phenylacetate-CoA ligase
MNPFYNPLFLLRIAQTYLSDIDRIWRLSPKEMVTYQDKQFRHQIKFAYTIPLYHEKFKSVDIHPADIHGINDIRKLPFITKNDLRKHYPQGIIPPGFDTQHALMVSTSGSTGKPVTIFLDKYSAIKSLIGFVRVLRAYNGNWKNSKTILVIDTGPGSIENAFFKNSAIPFLQRFISLDNIRYVNIDEPPEKVMEEIETFSPDFIGTDPNMMRQLAVLRNDGKGDDINPEKLFTSGSVLDLYTRKYVEKAFQTSVADMYGTTEAGPLAFECDNGQYHIHSDFVYLEALDEGQQPVSINKPGKLVVTKLYGGGTPIIRYTGISDIITPTENECNCGITTQIIKQIEGRTTDLLILPDGSSLSPLTITGIPAKIMDEYNTYKIKQFQIIQHTISHIEVLIVLDEKERDKGIPVSDLLNKLQNRFKDKIGQNVKVTVKEIKEIQKNTRSDYVQVVISKVNKD